MKGSYEYINVWGSLSSSTERDGTGTICLLALSPSIVAGTNNIGSIVGSGSAIYVYFSKGLAKGWGTIAIGSAE